MRSYYPLIFLFALCALTGLSAQAQVIREFTPRITVDTKGEIVLVSNNIITTKASAGAVYTQPPPNCGSTMCKNDGKANTNIDIDDDATTFNSSSADLSLGACNSIVFAGLYWGAGIAINQDANGAHPMKTPGWNEVKFKVPGGVYQPVLATAIDTVKAVFEGYQAFADVTELVRNAGAGTYTVANVICDTTKITNAFGGWTMVVIYSDPALPLRNLTVFDGLAVIGTSGGGLYTTRDITVNGFKCPPEGIVSAKIGVVVYDGDRSAKDGFYVKANSNGSFIDQTGAGESASLLSNAKDCWNSSITDKGMLVTSRMPAHANTYGYDAHMYTLNNTGNKYLRNGDNTATIRINTPSNGEGFALGLLTTEIDTYEPEIIMENTLTNLNGPTYKKEDTIHITSTLRNTGTDTATHATIVTKLASYFKYVPNSLVVDGITKTDAALDDVATYDAAQKTIVVNVGQGATAVSGGSIPNGDDIYTLGYKVTISSFCEDVGYGSKLLMLQSSVLYTDQLTGYSDSTASRPYSPTGCVLPVMPDTAFLSMGCDMILPITERPSSVIPRPQTERRAHPVFSPSPASSQTILRGIKNVRKLEWYSVNGCLVKTENNIADNQPLDVSQLAPGLYFVKVFTDKTMEVVRMVRH